MMTELMICLVLMLSAANLALTVVLLVNRWQPRTAREAAAAEHSDYDEVRREREIAEGLDNLFGHEVRVGLRRPGGGED